MSIWVRDSARNILSSENLTKLKSAFWCDFIFGHHYHYAGGCSRDVWAFQNYDQFMAYVARSRPGDMYEIWSLKELLEKKMALVTAQYDASLEDTGCILSPEQRQIIQDYLAVRFNEFITLCYLPGQEAIEALEHDNDGYDVLLELAQEYNRPGGQMYVLPLTRFEDEDAHLLLLAKYPNERGEIPLSGPY